MGTSEQLDHLINLDKVRIVVERPINQSLKTGHFCGSVMITDALLRIPSPLVSSEVSSSSTMTSPMVSRN